MGCALWQSFALCQRLRRFSRRVPQVKTWGYNPRLQPRDSSRRLVAVLECIQGYNPRQSMLRISNFGNPERFAKELFLAYFCSLIYHYAKD